MQRRLFWRGLLVLAVIAGSIGLILTRPARLGLDLKGGSQIVLEARDSGRQKADDDAVSRTLEVLRRRVDQLGVSEASLQRSGDRRIIVELPGVADPRQAVDVIGKTAQLEFRPVLSAGEAGQPQPTATGAEGNPALIDRSGRPIVTGPAQLTGDAVRKATAVIDQNGGWQITLDFTGRGDGQWKNLTGAAACAPEGDPRRLVAIVLDNKILLDPQVGPDFRCNEGIGGGGTVITGGFSENEAKELALLIRAGALPLPVSIVEQRTVGPTLGAAAVKASTRAAVIGALLTIVYMVAYYRLIGVAAAIALVLYGLISFAVLLAINATLTLPGIAGFVLAIGMAVDASVLVFERIREEYAARPKVLIAIDRGFGKALSAIADSNATTLLAAILLFLLGSGAVKGFGVSLSVGVIVSIFTAVVIARVLIELMVRVPALQRHPKLMGIEARRRITERLAAGSPDLMQHRRAWFALSLAAVVLAGAGLFARELNYGLDFTGGRLLEYSTQRMVNVDDLRSGLAQAGLPRALVQESGEGNVSIRAGGLNTAQESSVTRAVEELGGRAEKVRDEFVGPSLGNELRRKALVALGLALLAQLGYLALRFRWNFGLAAVAAMLHDVLILVGLFAWLGKQIDGVFLAALLTVIGYSINDSVVVFDRIREQRRENSSESLQKVANDACLQTIPRTINTGLGALFILGALYLLGGESLQDFALALIVGILVGTYSSVFTAAPLSVQLDKFRPAPAVVKKRPAHRPQPSRARR